MHDDFAGQEFWDERYGSQDRVWSDHPNPQLIAQVAGLTPGSALDVGAGEGGDARWLAAHGWRVTALDVSAVAVRRAAALTAAQRPEVVDRIEWTHGDVTTWTPVHAFELVSAHYFQMPPQIRDPVFRRLAQWVTDDGTLLVVGHHPSDLQTTAHRPPRPEVFFTAEDVAALLDPARWVIVTSQAPGRTVTDPDGNDITVRDAVLRARRRPA